MTIIFHFVLYLCYNNYSPTSGTIGRNRVYQRNTNVWHFLITSGWTGCCEELQANVFTTFQVMIVKSQWRQMSASSEPVVSKARDLNPATLSAGKAQTAAALVVQTRIKKRAVSPATHTTPQPNNNNNSSSSKKKKTQPAPSTTQAPVKN